MRADSVDGCNEGSTMHSWHPEKTARMPPSCLASKTDGLLDSAEGCKHKPQAAHKQASVLWAAYCLYLQPSAAEKALLLFHSEETFCLASKTERLLDAAEGCKHKPQAADKQVCLVSCLLFVLAAFCCRNSLDLASLLCRSNRWLWIGAPQLSLSFVVRKNIPAGNNSAECKESHSLFCSQKIHAKLENPVSKTTRVSPSNIIDSFRVRKKWRVQRNVIPSFVLS